MALTEQFGDLKEGAFTQLALADLDNDNWLDVVIGNQRGGLAIYNTNIALDGTTSTEVVNTSSELRIYPNPANTTIWLDWGAETPSNGRFELLNAQGQLVYSTSLTSTLGSIGLPKLPSGVYLVRLQTEEGYIVRRQIIQQTE